MVGYQLPRTGRHCPASGTIGARSCAADDPSTGRQRFRASHGPGAEVRGGGSIPNDAYSLDALRLAAKEVHHNQPRTRGWQDVDPDQPGDRIRQLGPARLAHRCRPAPSAPDGDFSIPADSGAVATVAAG